MAVSKDTIKAVYPLPVYNYIVEIHGSDGSAANVSFSEVSGLNIEYETTTYKESPSATGVPGPVTRHMPMQGTATTLTLKKGLVRSGSMAVFYNWISGTKINQTEKKDIYIRLLDETGTAVISWEVLNAFPTKLDAPTFDASSNDVSIESMELMADDLKMTEG